MTCRCDHTDPEDWEPVLSLGAGREGDSQAAKKRRIQDTLIAGDGCGHRGVFPRGTPGRRQHAPRRARKQALPGFTSWSA